MRAIHCHCILHCIGESLKLTRTSSEPAVMGLSSSHSPFDGKFTSVSKATPQVDSWFPIPHSRPFLIPQGLIHYFIIGGKKFATVLMNTCIVHLGTKKVTISARKRILFCRFFIT